MNSTYSSIDYKKIIDQKLSELSLPDKPANLYDPVRYTLSLGGKRVRPYLTLLGCGLCGGEVDEAMPAALSIELLHNFTLHHDDIMDAAETRRGKPSVFKKWDSSTAILSGDVMFARAFNQLQYYGRNDSYSKKQYSALYDAFLESAEKVCEGQAFDLQMAGLEEVDIEDYLSMVRGKTAALICGALKLGGIVAGADEEKLDYLEQLGMTVGTAFQIQDDLLDVVADPSKFGKEPSGDIIEGKKTYLSLLALQKANSEQKELLAAVYADDELRGKEVDNIVSLYHELGVVEKTRSEIKEYYDRALGLLGHFPDSDYRQELIDFISNLKSREY